MRVPASAMDCEIIVGGERVISWRREPCKCEMRVNEYPQSTSAVQMSVNGFQPLYPAFLLHSLDDSSIQQPTGFFICQCTKVEEPDTGTPCRILPGVKQDMSGLLCFHRFAWLLLLTIISSAISTLLDAELLFDSNRSLSTSMKRKSCRW